MKKIESILLSIKLLITCLILINASQNTYANPSPIINDNNTQLAIAFIKSQLSIKDSEVIIKPSPNQYKLDSCHNLYFSVTPSSHTPTNLRLLATCTAPQKWALFLNASIKKKQNYFITRRHLKIGEVIKAHDLQAKYDAQFSTIANMVTKFDETNNLTAAHDIKAGTILRQNDLTEQILVTRYQQVKIINQNNNFSVTTFGKSLNNASKDHSVRVQLSNKQVITGKAVAAGTIEISN